MLLRDEIQTYLQQSLPDYLELLRQMVEINSFTQNASGVNQLGKLTAASFSHLGFQAAFAPSKHAGYGQHLFLHRPAETNPDDKAAPAIAMISHLDTVFSPEEEKQNQFNYRLEDERIYGPGVMDIKGGSVVMLMVMDALQRFAPQIFDRTEWILAFNASEEVLSDDFGQFLIQRLPASTAACLVFEAGSPSSLPDERLQKIFDNAHQDEIFKIVTARKGRATFQVRVEGKSAHSGNHHANGANAIVQLAHTIQRLAALTDYAKQVTVNVGVVKGGSVTNRVPHYAEASVELRAFSPDVFQVTIDKILALSEAVKVASIDGYPCKVSIQTLDRTDPWAENQKTAQLFNAWRETAGRIGLQIVGEARGGLSDGNFLWEKYPTLDGLGPVGANAHCSERTADGSKDQEYALQDSFTPKALLNTLALIELLRPPARAQKP